MNQGAPIKTPTDFKETRIHILTASRELLLAAHGALRFCYNYVEQSGTASPNLVSFFKKAMNVADDLSSGLKNMNTIRRVASDAVKPIFTVLEEEMEAAKNKLTKNPSKIPTKKKTRTINKPSKTIK